MPQHFAISVVYAGLSYTEVSKGSRIVVISTLADVNAEPGDVVNNLKLDTVTGPSNPTRIRSECMSHIITHCTFGVLKLGTYRCNHFP